MWGLQGKGAGLLPRMLNFPQMHRVFRIREEEYERSRTQRAMRVLATLPQTALAAQDVGWGRQKMRGT